MNIKFNIDKGRQVFTRENVSDIEIEKIKYKEWDCLKVRFRDEYGDRNSVLVFPTDGDTYEIE